MDWTINVRYKTTEFALDAEKVYESDQIMRVKVHGRIGFILLENDYPFLIFTSSKKAIKWKLKNEGLVDLQSKEDCELVAEIIRKLEAKIKGKDQAIQDYINHIQAKP